MLDTLCQMNRRPKPQPRHLAGDDRRPIIGGTSTGGKSMNVPTVDLGGLAVSRFLMGGNPFSGFSHQSQERSREMVDWYTEDRIAATLFEAQALGLNACILRGDEHITSLLDRYWREGGTMRWIAQTNSRMGAPVEAAQYCLDHGASACFLHGGVMDHLIAQRDHDALYAFAESMRAAGFPAGVAGHMPEDFLWAEEHLDLDFYMVCYYNPSPRQDVPHHDPAAAEQYLIEDRDARVATIARLTRPVIHYKILAAGRTPPAEAFAYAAQQMRPSDAVCVGIYSGDNPNMLAEDVTLLLASLAAVGQ